MASPTMMDGNSDEHLTFPSSNPDEELNPSRPKNFPVDPISSNMATSKDLKDQAEADETKDKVKSALIISGVIVAVIGVIFAVSRKWKET